MGSVARDQAKKIKYPTDLSPNAARPATVSLAAHEKAMADKDDEEAAIRQEADPKGVYSRSTIDTASLVRYIRRRHRDCIEENRRDKNAMRIEKEDLRKEFNEEKDRLVRFIDKQKEAMRSTNEQENEMRKEYDELKNIYSDSLADNEAKNDRIAKLEGQMKTVRATCETVKNGSVEALRLADRRMLYRITCIEGKHREELNEFHGWNKTLQDQLRVAQRQRPVYIFHEAQVGTVCQMHEKLVQMKKAKKQELSAKEDEIKALGVRIHHYEQEMSVLEEVANADREEHEENASLLSNTQKALRKTEDQIRTYQAEIRSLNHRVIVWENRYSARSREVTELKRENFTLRAARHDELIEVQAKNGGLQVSNNGLRAANERMERELEAWENGCVHSLNCLQPKNNGAVPENVVASLTKALKAANARADTLQIGVNALRAENGILHEQLKNTAYTCDPQFQEQVERLEADNKSLREAAEEAERQKAQLIIRCAEEAQKVEERFASRTRELESEFYQGFESLRALRDQWLLEKRRLEVEHNRHIVAADLQHQIERQGREDRFIAVWNQKAEGLERRENDLQRMENDLRIREATLALPQSSDQNRTIQAGKAKAEVSLPRPPATNHDTNRNLIEQNFHHQIASLRRDGQRYLDLLNEETGKTAGDHRLIALHSGLQYANCSIQYFRYQIDSGETNSEALSQALYWADINESDIAFLHDQGRPVLLAQLQAAKKTLEQLRSLLAEGPNVEVDKAISILVAPRGDEDAAQPPEDFFGPSNEPQQPTQESNPRKRSGAPLGNPTYGAQDDNTAYDDGGDQALDTGAKISTVEEVLARRIQQPKSRRN